MTPVCPVACLVVSSIAAMPVQYMLQNLQLTAGELALFTAANKPFRIGVTLVPLQLRAAFMLQHTLVLSYLESSWFGQ